MGVIGEYKSRSISGINDELWDMGKLVAKKFGFSSISSLIHWLLKAAVKNAQDSWESQAKQGQFVQHSVNDTFKFFMRDR